MTVLFIHPHLRDQVSGGNVYNEHIIRKALENNYPLQSLALDDHRNEAEITRQIVCLEPSVVVWDSLFFDLIANLARKIPKVVHVLLVHYLPSLNPGLHSASRARRMHSESRAIRNCARIICTGLPTFENLSLRHPESPRFLCRPGVDDIFRPVDKASVAAPQKKHIDLISVANLLAEKGLSELLQVLASLETKQWVWHIAGSDRSDRAYSELLWSTATRLGLISQIRYHGILSPEHLAILLSQMDVFVSASRYEAYGMAVAEAVAAGLPVISTRTGCATEMVEDGHSGFLVPVGDRNSMTSALNKLILDPELRMRFALNCRARPRHSWRNCFELFKQACVFDP